MKILKINPLKPESKIISEAASILKLGGIIVYPTDTCYGLGADITNAVALRKIFRIKERDRKGISMIVRDIDLVDKYAEIDNNRKNIMKKYFPGAVTFVLLNIKYQEIKMNTVAFRIPDYKITKALLKKIGFPLTTTSANISGKNVCYSIGEVLKQFKNKNIQPDLILDAGNLKKNLPSTVVDLISWPPRILRQGSVNVKEAK